MDEVVAVDGVTEPTLVTKRRGTLGLDLPPESKAFAVMRANAFVSLQNAAVGAMVISSLLAVEGGGVGDRVGVSVAGRFGGGVEVEVASPGPGVLEADVAGGAVVALGTAGTGVPPVPPSTSMIWRAAGSGL